VRFKWQGPGALQLLIRQLVTERNGRSESAWRTIPAWSDLEPIVIRLLAAICCGFSL